MSTDPSTNPVDRYVWSPPDIAAAMMKEKKIHQGLWMVLIEFKTLGLNSGPSPKEIFPSVIIPITGVGIIRVEQPGPLVFDAAQINPAPEIAKSAQIKREKEKVAAMRTRR